MKEASNNRDRFYTIDDRKTKKYFLNEHWKKRQDGNVLHVSFIDPLNTEDGGKILRNVSSKAVKGKPFGNHLFIYTWTAFH